MISDADRDIQFFAACVSRPRQNREMVVGRDSDEGAVPPSGIKPRDRQIGVAGDPVLRDDRAGGDIRPGFLFEEARDRQFGRQRRARNDCPAGTARTPPRDAAAASRSRRATTPEFGPVPPPSPRQTVAAN